jgi:phosphoglycerate kinase
VLLENVRFHKGETKGDRELAKAYAKLGDVFVNDAFGTSHRDESSVSGPRGSCRRGGQLLERELAAFRRVLETRRGRSSRSSAARRSRTRLPVSREPDPAVRRAARRRRDGVHAAQGEGEEIGASKLQADQLDAVKQSLAAAEKRGCRILCRATTSWRSASPRTRSRRGDEDPAGSMALDIGPETQKRYAAEIAAAKTVVWNGPMGVFEWESFRAGTAAVAQAVAECRVYTVVGGGDLRCGGRAPGRGRRRSSTSRRAAARRSSSSAAKPCPGSRGLQHPGPPGGSSRKKP